VRKVRHVSIRREIEEVQVHDFLGDKMKGKNT
jgi:hypothetical protein